MSRAGEPSIEKPETPNGALLDPIFPSESRLSTGIDGFDEILDGGLIPNRAYLLRGGPGSGKTILGLHFLTAALSDDEPGLFISFEEPEAELRANAAAIGIDLEDVHILDLTPDSEFFVENQTQTVFHAGELETEPLTEVIIETVGATAPARVFLDPVTQLRYYVSDDLQFRKEILSLIRFLQEEGATVLFTSQPSNALPDDDLQFLSHGTVTIEADHDVRTLEVTKFRGSDFKSGEHTLRIANGGARVFPRLTSRARQTEVIGAPLSSGVPELDAILHGGIEPGTVTIISGPTGAGKSTLGTQFMKEAAGRSQHSVMYLFEEALEAVVHRSEAVNIPVKTMLDHSSLVAREIAPLSISPDEFANLVKTDVEEHDASIVMIDGMDGYRLSMGLTDTTLSRELTNLTRYLKNQGVAVILVDEVGSVTTDFQATSEGISYLADNIVFIRNLEVEGQLQKAIGVLKKRLSDYERTLREFKITRHGIRVGEPLTGIQGVLNGDVETNGEYEPREANFR